MKHTEGPWFVFSEQYPRVGPTHNRTVAGVEALKHCLERSE